MIKKIKLIYFLSQLLFVAVFVAALFSLFAGKLILLIITLLTAIFLIWGIFDIRLSLFVPAINKLKIKDKKVFLTFDDGPSVYTEKILDILEKENISAGFFLIGKNLTGYENTVKRISKSGHLLGIHTQNHSVRFTFSGMKFVKNEISDCQNILEQITGNKIQFFRPPFGVTNPVIALVIKEMNLKTVGWNLRSFDTQSKDKNRLIKRIVSRLSPGGIILLHDIQLTASILEELIAEIRKKGYEFNSYQ